MLPYIYLIGWLGLLGSNCLASSQMATAEIPKDRRTNTLSSHKMLSTARYLASYAKDLFFFNSTTNQLGKIVRRQTFDWSDCAILQNILSELFQQGVQGIVGYCFQDLSDGQPLHPGNILYWISQQKAYRDQIEAEIFYISTEKQPVLDKKKTLVNGGVRATYSPQEEPYLREKIKAGWMCMMHNRTFSYQILDVFQKEDQVAYLIFDPTKRGKNDIYTIDKSVLTEKIHPEKNYTQNLFLLVRKAPEGVHNGWYERAVFSDQNKEAPIRKHVLNRNDDEEVYPFLVDENNGVRLLEAHKDQLPSLIHLRQQVLAARNAFFANHPYLFVGCVLACLACAFAVFLKRQRIWSLLKEGV